MLLDEFMEYYKQNKHNASQIIFRLKNHIEENGIKSNGNVITRMSEEWSIFLVGAVFFSWGGMCFWFGQYFTQNKIDIEKIRMENRIDSLVKVTHTFVVHTNKPTNNETTKGIDKQPK